MTSSSALNRELAAPPASGERWDDVLRVMRARLPEREFETWLAPARFLDDRDGTVRLEVPNSTFANHLEGEYRDPILEAFESLGSPKSEIHCQVAGDGRPSGSGGANGELADAVEAGARLDLARSDPLAASYTFESFVVGTSNRHAHAAALAVSDPGVEHSPYNPLLIYGDVGLGKTHLLQSIARRLLDERPERRILYTKGEAFTRQVVHAVRTQNLYGFRDECSRLDVLLVDDIQFIAGLDRFGRSTEEFFHTLNALSDRGRQVVLTANLHPHDIKNLDKRIKSRLEQGLVADIGQPDWEMRVAIVSKKAEALGVTLPDGIAKTIATRFRGHVRELEGALKRLIATAAAEGIEPSAALLNRILSSASSRRRRRRPSIGEVLLAVATDFGIQALRLKGPQRSQELVLARHVAMYLCRELTGRTLKEIGQEFRRDHSTVNHGVRRIAKQRTRDLGLDRTLERLSQQLS